MKKFTNIFPHLTMRLGVEFRPIALFALLLVTGGLQPVHAQWATFDAANFARNAVTAVESVNATAQRASSYVAQLQQYQAQLTNLKRLSPADLQNATYQLNRLQSEGMKFGGDMSKLRDIQSIAAESQSVSGSISNAQSSLASLNRLSNSLGGVNQSYSQRFEEARRMGLTWDQYASREDLQIRSRVATAAFRAEEDMSRMNNVQKDYEFAQEMAAKIPEAEGVQQSMGIMNTQMNRVVTQLAQLNKGLSTSLNSKTPADVLAEEQKKQQALDNARIARNNIQIQRDARDAALEKWMVDAAAEAKAGKAK
jgi:conjugal transfer/entry exclusion protein